MPRQVDQTAPSEPELLHISGTRVRIRCPWCGTWEPEEAFTELQTPPNFPQQCGIVLKHGGPGGCKGIFSLRALVRPAKAMGT